MSKQTQNGTDKLRVLGWIFGGLAAAIAVAEIAFTKDGGGGFVRAAVLVVAAGTRALGPANGRDAFTSVEVAPETRRSPAVGGY